MLNFQFSHVAEVYKMLIGRFILQIRRLIKTDPNNGKSCTTEVRNRGRRRIDLEMLKSNNSLKGKETIVLMGLIVMKQRFLSSVP